MEKKNDSTILLLVAAGLGIYWFMKNKSLPPATTPTTTSGSSSADVEVKSTQPVYNAPVTQTPTTEKKDLSDIFSSDTGVWETLTTGGINAKKDEAYR
jgi:hypothetical protein